MSKEPTDAENDMIAELLYRLIKELQPFLEGKFLDRFSTTFIVDREEYTLSLNKKGKEQI